MKDDFFMELALKQAAKGRPSPNPYVGAVVVKNGKVISTGFHKRAGKAHAEIEALKRCNAKNCVLYVTLEPCSHYGKTPPCVDVIIASGVRRVVYAMQDPNPITKGEEKLKKAGIEVKKNVLKEQAEKLNEVFIKAMKSIYPFVVVKTAMSLDGKIALGSGESKWITSKKAREYGRRLRDKYESILVGINTVLNDDPRLTGVKRDPLRILLDSKLKIPLNARALADSNVIIATSDMCSKKKKKQLEKNGITVWVIGGKIVDLKNLLKKLRKIGVTSVLIEGGAEVNFTAFKEGLVDKVFFFIAPKIIGGSTSLTPVGGKGVVSISDAFDLQIASVKNIGNDLLVEAKVNST